MEGSFTVVDYLVFIGTLVVSLLIGAYYAFIKTQKTNDDLLVGNRNMSVIPCCLSLVATYMSAILVLGYSGEIHSHGTLISETIVGIFFYLPLGGFLFLPTLYGLKLTSAYEYLELRFKSQTVRFLATGTFIIQIILYMGVVLYAPAIALKAVVDFPIWASIFCVGGSAALYTYIGGLKAVIWTDTFQIIMMFAGMIAIIIQGTIDVGGIRRVFDICKENHRIEYLNFKVDPFLRHTTLNIFFGQGALWMSAYGCHQTTVQRYCSMGSLKKAFFTLLLTVPVLAITMGLAALTGLVVFANYAGCDPVTLGFIERSDQIAPFFVLDKLSSRVGILGLFIACLFSGALSSISSAINSLAAVTWEDFCTKILFFRSMSDSQQGMVTKVIGLAYGGIAIGMGFFAQNLGGVLTASLLVNGAVSGPLLGTFILGILIPFANKQGAISGMLTAHLITFSISIGSVVLDRKPPNLPFRIDECSNETLSKVDNLQLVMLNLNNSYVPPEIEWPQKMYTISYTLYPLIGAFITITVGSLVSLLTGPSSLTKDQEKYIHPLIVKFCGKKESWNEDLILELANQTDHHRIPEKQYKNGKHNDEVLFENDPNGYKNPAFHCD